MQQHSHHLSWKKKLAFTCVCAIIFLVVAELAARAVITFNNRQLLYRADEILGYTLRPSLDAERHVNGYRWHFRTDDDGRRLVPANPPGDAAPTVVVLGDSFAFGEGVDDEDTWVATVAASGFHVVNLGVPGYGTNQELLALRQYLRANERSHIDWIVVLVFTNDGEDARSTYKSMRHRPSARLEAGKLRLNEFHVPWSDYVVDESYLCATLRHAFAKGIKMEPGDGPAIVASCLSQIDSDSRAVGAKPLFFVHDALDPKKVADFISSAQKQGVSLEDLTPALGEVWANGRAVIGPDRLHWTPEGNHAVAEVVLSHLN